jgi:hypothetical protein
MAYSLFTKDQIYAYHPSDYMAFTSETSVAFEILDFPFVFLSGFSGFECAKIAAFFCFRIDFPGIKPVLPGI